MGLGDATARLWGLDSEGPIQAIRLGIERKLATGGHDGHVGSSYVGSLIVLTMVYKSGYGTKKPAKLLKTYSKCIGANPFVRPTNTFESGPSSRDILNLC